MSDCVFCKIVAKEIPADVVHETDTVLAFRDISPEAPTHVQVIPKAHHPDLPALASADRSLAGELLAAAVAVAEAEGLDRGFRTIVNTGDDSGREVLHVHVHVLGGAPLGPMLAR